MRTWAICKPQKTWPAHTHWSMTIPSRKMAAHEGAFMSFFTRQSGGQRVLPSQDNEDTQQQFSRAQLKSFYRLSTRDVTHVRECTRPSPALPYCKRREAGQGPGNEARCTAKIQIQWRPSKADPIGTTTVFEVCIFQGLPVYFRWPW